MEKAKLHRVVRFMNGPVFSETAINLYHLLHADYRKGKEDYGNSKEWLLRDRSASNLLLSSCLPNVLFGSLVGASCCGAALVTLV